MAVLVKGKERRTQGTDVAELWWEEENDVRI